MSAFNCLEVTDFLGVMRTIRLRVRGPMVKVRPFYSVPPSIKSFALFIDAMSKLKRRDSFHDTTAETIDQETIDMSKYFDKVVLIVNVASR